MPTGSWRFDFSAPLSAGHEKLAISLIGFAGRESQSNLNRGIFLRIAVNAHGENIHGGLARKLIRPPSTKPRIQAQSVKAVIIRPDR